MTREVLLCGPFAVKLPSLRSWPLFLKGLLCNLSEADRASWPGWWGKVPDVHASMWGFLLVVDRALPPGADYTPDMERLREQLDFAPEPKASSFGWLHGRLVAVDYGDSL